LRLPVQYTGTAPKQTSTPAPGGQAKGNWHIPDPKTHQLEAAPVGFRGRSGVDESRDSALPAEPCHHSRPQLKTLT